MKFRAVCLGLFSAAMSVTVNCSAAVTAMENSLNSQSSCAQADASYYRQTAQEEKMWILQCQTDEGLILHRQWKPGREDTQTVRPYFSSIAAIGLLSGASVSKAEAQGARAYINWYLDHLNTEADDPVNGDGTVYDVQVKYTETGIRYKRLQEYDSVDSYAALFLLLAGQYAEKIGTHMLSERAEDVIRVADALLNTISENGLACCKQENQVQYLMDNSEVYAGLKAGAELLGNIAPERPQGMLLEQAAQRLKTSVEQYLWNKDENHYEIGIKKDVVLREMKWSEFYPDSTSQLFPFCFGILDAAEPRVQELYNRFCEEWKWEKLEHIREKNDFYWCILAWAAAKHQDYERADAFIREYREIIQREGRDGPLYTAEAGWLAAACSCMEDR